MRRLCAGVLVLVLAATGSPAQEAWQPSDGWHTLHHDVMRSGRTKSAPAAPFEYAWHREYWDEIIAPEAEPIVAEGKVFLGTFKGILRALEADTGREAWKVDLGSPVRHSPAYAGGRLFAATLSPRGEVAAFEAATGKELWRFRPEQRGGFAASPAVYRDTVCLGDRAGDFYALDAATGTLRWKTSLGAPVLQTAAARDGTVAVAAEDLVPRLLDAATGKELWRGPPMQGTTVRGYYPVFWGDRVVWRTAAQGLDAYHNDIQEATEEGRLYRETRRKLGWSKEAEAVVRSLPGRYTDEKYRQEQTHVLKRMTAGQHPRSFYALRIADGTEPAVYAVGDHSSENGYSTPASPPVAADGTLYVFTKSVYSEWTYPIRAFDALGVLDRASPLPALVRHIDRSRGSFPATCDESNNLVLAGDKLFDTHDHVLAYMELGTRKVVNAFSSHAPELWGGVWKAYGPDRVPAEKPGAWKLRDPSRSLHLTVQWNGPAQGSVAIVGDRVWWITGSMVVALKGTVRP